MKAAATTFRAIPPSIPERAIMELGTGEALVSTLDDKGQPTIVQKTLVRPPNSRVGPITDAELKAVIRASPVAGVYDETVDRELGFGDPAEARSGGKGLGPERWGNGEQQGRRRLAQRRPGTTFLNSIIRSAVPVAARVLESALKNYTRKR